jgi:hypothetical protein
VTASTGGRHLADPGFLAVLVSRATALPGCRRARWTWIGPRRAKTIRRKLAELAEPAKPESRPGAGVPSRRRPPRCPRVLYMDGHARAYFVTRQVQKPTWPA